LRPVVCFCTGVDLDVTAQAPSRFQAYARETKPGVRVTF